MSEVNTHIKLKVERGHGGQTLEKYLKKSKLGMPFGLMQKLLRKEAIRVNGKRAKAKLMLNEFDEITIPAESRGEVKKPEYKPTKEDAEKYLTQNIIFEDKNCIAINKPQGLASQGGSNVIISVDSLLPFISKDGRYMLVHRLDRHTSGVLLIAKNLQAAQILGDSFKHKFVEKTYLALVAGKLMHEGGINYPLGKRMGAGGNEKIVVDEENGKKAFTEYTVLENYGPTATLVAVTPLTGRKHQIRVHMAAIGHPIVGDGKYGGSKAFVPGLPKVMHLHAWKLRHLQDYFKGTIEAKPPKHFQIEDNLSD